jgi:hypothetical protein
MRGGADRRHLLKETLASAPLEWMSDEADVHLPGAATASNSFRGPSRLKERVLAHGPLSGDTLLLPAPRPSGWPCVRGRDPGEFGVFYRIGPREALVMENSTLRLLIRSKLDDRSLPHDGIPRVP